jgi:hypothetical protein
MSSSSIQGGIIILRYNGEFMWQLNTVTDDSEIPCSLHSMNLDFSIYSFVQPDAL